MARASVARVDDSLLDGLRRALQDASIGPERQLEALQAFRAASADGPGSADLWLLGEIARLRGGLDDAHARQVELQALLDKMTAPPWHPAIFLGAATVQGGPAAIVAHGTSRRIVQVHDEVPPDSLAVGDEVLLASALNVIVATCGDSTMSCGEVAAFDRRTPDGRVVLNARDEEVVVTPAARLDVARLKSGDLVRWDRSALIALEHVDRSKGNQLFLEECPSETFDDIGGLDEQIRDLQRAVMLRQQHGSLLDKYSMKPKRSALLWGPPGTGKTMLARALANYLRQVSPCGRARFMNVKPASLHSMWYSQTERNYREAFRAAREAGAVEPDVPVVIYFDEVDAIGGARGGAVAHVDDRVLTAFMAELDGLEARGNVMVVASTNRPDVLDPGLTRPGRLGDLVIRVPTPDRKAARAIFGKHLPPAIPYARNGHGSDVEATREEILDAVVSRVYAPNGDSDLAVMMFRDGKRRSVKARDLVSGAVIAKIAQTAVERACLREAEGGEAGVRLDDVTRAADAELSTVARVLTPGNCRAYLRDLPQDVDVVSVQPIEKRVARPERYLAGDERQVER